MSPIMLSLDTRERRSTIWSVTHAAPGHVRLRPDLYDNFSNIPYGLFSLALAASLFLFFPHTPLYLSLAGIFLLFAYALLTVPLQRIHLFYPPDAPHTLHVRGTALFLLPVRRRLRNPAALVLRPELLRQGTGGYSAPKGYLWIASVLSDDPRFDVTLSLSAPDVPPSLPPATRRTAATLAESLHLPPPQLL